ncbi:hypothetical protein GGX14DRAFT_597624 [Mycena pura]|uniref:Uncharacterized protein n=1 Tax=Mycena pura TaxID=153505 RepID=A0AAD6VMJ9_9AGAR|nr:hypothetical protein GGX14DRAFT_597624 [Mycena pura]
MSSSFPRAERKSTTSTRSDLPRPSPAPRVSLISAVVPYLRRGSGPADDMPTHHKAALVTLKLSSQSFLDSVIKDDASRNPLYVIRTTGTSTNILRADPWDSLTKTAEIKWPKVVPTKGKTRETLGVLVQMNSGRWQPAETVLKPGTMLSAPLRFNIPNYSHGMKWKRVGNTYECTTSAVKGPVATLHPAIEGVPPRITVFETLHDKYDSRPVTVHKGVSTLLIDHLIITALLLVTDVQDWMLVQKYEGDELAPSIAPHSSSSSDQLDSASQSSPASASQSAPASASQWRKVLYGEPIYPRRYQSTNLRSVSTTDLSTPLPRSTKQMAKIVYGDPIYPSLTSSPVTTAWDSEEEDEEDDLDAWRAQQGSYSALASPQSAQFPSTHTYSPSSESIHDGHPPSHTYMDPSFYGEDIPPVPQIPAQYASSISTSSRGTTPPNSARSRVSRTLRELPSPPPPLSPSWPTHRSQSTPPREVQVPGRRPSEPLFLTPSTSSSPQPPARTLSRSQSMKLRQLPRPPTGAASDVQRPDMRSARRVSQFGVRSLPLPPGASGPPPLPRPLPQLKVTGDELWMYSWTTNAGGRRTAPIDAPPPYVAHVDAGHVVAPEQPPPPTS